MSEPVDDNEAPVDVYDLKNQRIADAKRERQERKKQAEEKADFEWLAGDLRGRRILRRLFDITGINRNPYTGKREDTDFKCGELNIGQHFLAKLVNYTPNQYVRMIAEHQKELDDNG